MEFSARIGGKGSITQEELSRALSSFYEFASRDSRD
jgi:hypothetical protein